jgi:hypothetical protein
MKVKKISDYTPAEVGFLSRSTLEAFEDQNANLMATMDATAVYTAIASFLRIEGLEEIKDNFDLKSLLRITQRAFLTLLNRGALDSFNRFPEGPGSLAQQELDAMNLAVNGEALIPDATGDSSTKDLTPDPIAECATDFHVLGSKDFKQKWMSNSDRRAIYDTAISQGAI